MFFVFSRQETKICFLLLGLCYVLKIFFFTKTEDCNVKATNFDSCNVKATNFDSCNVKASNFDSCKPKLYYTSQPHV